MRATWRSTSRLPAAALCVLMVFVASTSTAHAQSTGSRLSSAQQEANKLKSEYERIGEQFARIEAERGQTAIRVSGARSRIAQTQAQLAKLRDGLKVRIREAYKQGGVGVFTFLLTAKSFREFSLRYVVLQQQSLLDEKTILDLRRTRAQLESEQKELKSEQGTLTTQSNDLKRQGQQLSVSLDEANRLVRDLKGRLKMEQIQKLFHIAAAPRQSALRGDGSVISMAACPVAGPHYVTNSFGDPRGGGTRSHQGNDIMAAKGVPVVAVVDGVAYRRTGGLGGLAYQLQGSSALFYYAHLNDFVVPDGAHVAAGQLIGHNGNTGDAAGGPDHVHFEIHPGSGWTQAIDPYPSLMRVC